MAAMVSVAAPGAPLLVSPAPSSGPSSPVADMLERAWPADGHAPEAACDRSGSDGAALLPMETKEDSDLQKHAHTHIPVSNGTQYTVAVIVLRQATSTSNRYLCKQA